MASIEPNLEPKPAPKTPARKGKALKEADQRLKQAQRASILLKHVSDPTRLQVILILAEGEQHVGRSATSSARASPPSATTSPCSGTAGSSPRAARARTTSTA